MYNVSTMLYERFSGRGPELKSKDPIELFYLCAADRDDSRAWTEFLRRYSEKLRQFIYGSLRQFLGSQFNETLGASSGIQEDLFQNAIVRLVEKDCAAMRRFSGESEKDLLAYLAVICRSTVLDSLKHSSALKRRPLEMNSDPVINAVSEQPEFEREILLREIMELTRDSIQSSSGETSHRDQLVFEMHFLDGLSCGQIAQCKGVNLSKAGVEKLVRRLVGRVQNRVSGKSEETIQ